MTIEGYWRIRLFQFLVTVFMGQAFQEFNKALTRAGLDYGTLAKLVAGDRARWTPGVAALLDRFLQGARDELIDRKDLKRRFSADDVAQARANVALVPYMSCYLAAHRAIVDDFKLYLQRLVASGLSAQLTPASREELATCLAVAFDKLVCYEPFVREKSAVYSHDFDAWLSAGAREPLESFRTASPVTCLYQLEPGLEASIDRARDAATSLVDTLYRVRINALGKIPGDRLFCYRRVTAAADRRDSRASLNAAHANLASRQ